MSELHEQLERLRRYVVTTPPAQTDDVVDDIELDDGPTPPTGDNQDPAPEPAPPASRTDPSPLDVPTDDPTANLRKALASERKLRKDAEARERAALRKAASAEELALLEAKETAAAEAVSTLKPQMLKEIASAKLQAAGVSGNAARLVGLFNMSEVDVTEQGVVGLDDQIEGLKAEFPHLFASSNGKASPRPAPKANAGNGAAQGRQQDNSSSSGKKPGFAEILAAQVLGSASPS
jgi:hypothetical protein